MNSESNGAGEGGFDLPVYFPVLTTLAQSNARARTLSSLGELSFIAGRAGDEPADWEADIDGAIAEAFGALRPDRRARLKRLMKDAFTAGLAHSLIDEAEVPAEAAELARAYALIHRHETRRQCERSPVCNHFEAERIAYHVADKCDVDPWQAARAAIDALAEQGLRGVPTMAHDVVCRGKAGQRERDARLALQDAAGGDALLASIFDEEIGQ